MTIKAVFFDFAGVLTAGFGGTMLEIAADAELDIGRLAEMLLPIFMADESTPSDGHRLERGELALDEFFESLGDDADQVKVVLHPDSPHYFGHKLTPVPEMHAFVAELREQGYRTGVISNSVREWHAQWDIAMPPAELFDTVVLSADVGLRKPEPAIYELALGNVGVAAEEAVFLDDFENMVAGAVRAGMHAVHVTDHAEAIAEVRTLLGA